MDIANIVSAALDVLEGLKGLGLDLGDILSSLSGDDFSSQLDAGAFASKSGFVPEAATQAPNLIAPLIENSAGNNLGALGKLAGKFFN